MPEEALVRVTRAFTRKHVAADDFETRLIAQGRDLLKEMDEVDETLELEVVAAVRGLYTNLPQDHPVRLGRLHRGLLWLAQPSH